MAHFTLGPTRDEDLERVIRNANHNLSQEQARMIVAVADGNIGAARALGEISLALPDTLTVNTLVTRLVDLRIEGPWVWVLYKDTCRFNARTFLAVLFTQSPQLFSRHVGERGFPLLTGAIIEHSLKTYAERFEPL